MVDLRRGLVACWLAAAAVVFWAGGTRAQLESPALSDLSGASPAIQDLQAECSEACILCIDDVCQRCDAAYVLNQREDGTTNCEPIVECATPLECALCTMDGTVCTHCHLGYLHNAETMTCEAQLPCADPDTCNECAATEDTCYVCQPNYILTDDRTCANCTDIYPFCDASEGCNANGCFACQDGYGFPGNISTGVKDFTQCVTCEGNCDNCFLAEECYRSSCYEGFAWVPDGAYGSCEPIMDCSDEEACAMCAGSNATCVECNEGFLGPIKHSAVCVACQANNCDRCVEDDPNTCKTCAPGYWGGQLAWGIDGLDQGECYPMVECSQPGVQGCSNPCLNMPDESQVCLFGCKEDYFATMVDETFGVTNFQCLPMMACAEHPGAGHDGCVCVEEMVGPISLPVCVACMEGYGLVAAFDGSTCVECSDPQCKICHGMTPTECLLCMPNYHQECDQYYECKCVPDPDATLDIVNDDEIEQLDQPAVTANVAVRLASELFLCQLFDVDGQLVSAAMQDCTTCTMACLSPESGCERMLWGSWRQAFGAVAAHYAELREFQCPNGQPMHHTSPGTCVLLDIVGTVISADAALPCSSCVDGCLLHQGCKSMMWAGRRVRHELLDHTYCTAIDLSVPPADDPLL